MSLSLDLESIILLLFFIAPGFLFTRTYTAYRPRYYRAASAFEQFILAIVGSTIIHAALLTTLAIGILIYWGFTGQLYYLNNVFTSGAPIGSYPLPDLARSISGGIVYLVLSLILARRFATFLGRGAGVNRPHWWKIILGEDPPEPFLLWHTVLQIEPLELDLIPPHLSIKMRSGEYFEGNLYRLRLVGDEENTVELALSNVFHRDANGNQAHELRPLSNQILLLRSSDILWLARSDIPQ
jgi:hypothetical protein